MSELILDMVPLPKISLTAEAAEMIRRNEAPPVRYGRCKQFSRSSL